MSQPIRILYVDDNALDRELVRDALEKEHGGFKLVTAASHTAFEKALAKGGFDLILSDFNILGFEGLQVLEMVRAKDSNLPVVIVTGTGSEETAVEALKRGASDYIIKTPKHIRRLPQAIQAVLEKKQAEEAQREIEQQYRSLFETSPIGIGVADMQGNLLTFNDAILLPGGYTRKDIKRIGGVTGLYYDLNQRNEALTLLKKQGFLRNHPVQFKRKDGTVYDALLTLVPIVFQGQACLQALVEDITERKRAEKSLQDSELRYHAIFDGVREAIFVEGPTGEIFNVNESACRMYGYSREEFLKKKVSDLVPSGQLALGIGENGIGNLSDYPVETLNLRANGESFPVEISGHLQRINGQPTLLVVVRDITERKQAEAELRESEEKFKTLFNSANDAIFTMNHTTFLDCNATTERIFRCSRDQIVGHSPVDFSPEQQPDGSLSSKSAAEKIEAAFAGESQFFEWLHTHLDGTPFNAEVSLNRVFIGDDFILQAIVRDVSERKQWEEKTLRLNRLYATLSQINQAIVRVREPEVLFEEICRVAVEFGQFRMAWIGLMDETDELVRPVKFAGEEQGYLSSVRIKYVDESLGRGPVGTAIREGRCIVFQDIDADPRMEPWREQALLRGYRSLAAVPFRRNNVVIGALTVYAAEPHGFDMDAENLLEEIGSDISFALDSMQAAKQRQQAENELKRLKDFNENMINSMAEGIVVQNTDGYFTFVNPATSAMTGYPPEELIGSHWTKFIPADQQEIIKETDRRRLAGEASRYEIEFLHKSGKRIHQLVSGSPLFENGQFNGTMAIFMDISERARAQAKIRRSEEQLAAVMEGSQLGFSDWNIQKGEVHKE